MEFWYPFRHRLILQHIWLRTIRLRNDSKPIHIHRGHLLAWRAMVCQRHRKGEWPFATWSKQLFFALSVGPTQVPTMLKTLQAFGKNSSEETWWKYRWRCLWLHPPYKHQLTLGAAPVLSDPAPLMGRFKSSWSRFRNSSTDSDVVYFKKFKVPCNSCTSCCSICLSISTACAIALNRIVSTVAVSLNSVSFIAWPFATSSSIVSLSFSACSPSILEVKLVSGFCPYGQWQSSNEHDMWSFLIRFAICTRLWLGHSNGFEWYTDSSTKLSISADGMFTQVLLEKVIFLWQTLPYVRIVCTSDSLTSAGSTLRPSFKPWKSISKPYLSRGSKTTEIFW